MSVELTIFLYVLFGFLAGIFGGLGMGGGTILIPLLSIFLNLDQKLCQGINLVSFLVMALFSLVIHYKNGYIVLKNTLPIILSGIIFTILGALLAGSISSSILKIVFGIFLCILAIIEIFKVILQFKNDKYNNCKN